MEQDRSLRFVNLKEIEDPQIFGIDPCSYLVPLNPPKRSGHGIYPGCANSKLTKIADRDARLARIANRRSSRSATHPGAVIVAPQGVPCHASEWIISGMDELWSDCSVRFEGPERCVAMRPVVSSVQRPLFLFLFL